MLGFAAGHSGAVRGWWRSEVKKMADEMVGGRCVAGEVPM